MIYDTPGEQGFEMKLHGTPRRTVVDFDGVQLIRVENGIVESNLKEQEVYVQKKLQFQHGDHAQIEV